MKYTYKKMAGGGSVKSEKGYTAKDRKAIRSLIEELADPHSVDVTGGSSVTVIKKPKKRMAAGGMADIGRKMAKNYNRSGVFGQPVVKRAAAGNNSENGMVKMARGMAKAYHRTGTFGTPRNMADGGIVGRPARSYRDMKAGAGSGVGRIQKTKIARGR